MTWVNLYATTRVANSKLAFSSFPTGLVLRVIDQLGGKQVVMSLLQHPDPSVRYNALLALQKIMVHNWCVYPTRLKWLSCSGYLFLICHS